jgi:hypothetical protein
MKAPANIQMINGTDGKPAFVAMPYADFVKAYAGPRFDPARGHERHGLRRHTDTRTGVNI